MQKYPEDNQATGLPHRTLNSSKFVIKCEELGKMEEEIKQELQAQGIIAAKKSPYATVCTF